MSHNDHSGSQLSLNPVALSSYAVAICSFAGATLGLVSSHFPSAGLAAVGGFYLVVGVVSQLTAKSPATELPHHATGHPSSVENLVAEAMIETVEPVSTSARQRDFAAATR